MILPFTPTRPVPVNDSPSVQVSFPIVRSSDGKTTECGSVAVITLNAPEKLNAMTFDDMQTLYTLMEWINEQSDVQMTVLTGRGRFFSAGANFSDPARAATPSEWTEYGEEHVLHQSSKRNWAVNRSTSTNGMAVRIFHNHSKLLVAAMNGPAVGIMAAMVAMCDLIYTLDNFYILTPFSQLALVAEAGSTITFPAKMGLGRAQQALIEGRKILAPELFQSGFISRIFPTPPPPANLENPKHYTAPILDDVLAHLADRLLPPNVDTFAINETKRLLRQSAYQRKSIFEMSAEEVHGAQTVFRAGRPQKRFARLASGGRHKL